MEIMPLYFCISERSILFAVEERNLLYKTQKFLIFKDKKNLLCRARNHPVVSWGWSEGMVRTGPADSGMQGQKSHTTRILA